MKLFALPLLLALSSPAAAYTVDFSTPLTPAAPGALDTCVGQQSCDLGFGELTLDNSSILPANFSVAGVALAPPNGVAYVGVGAGLHYGAGGFAYINMFDDNVTSFSYDIGSVDSVLFDDIVNSVVVFTEAGHIGVDGLETLLAFNPHPAYGSGNRDGHVMVTPDIGDYITSVRMFASTNAMEISNFGVTEAVVIPQTVPEASTWFMMLAGFAGLGIAALRRKRECPVSL